MTQLLLCDDHPLILEGFSSLLRQRSDFEVVAAVTDGSEALRALREIEPDIALLDLNIPHFDGLTLLRTISREGWRTRVILLSASMNDAQIVEAIAAGVAGILLKESAPQTLLHCLRTVARGERWLPPDLIHPALRRHARGSPPSRLVQLTRREMDVVKLVAATRSNREIASTLNLSEGTVKMHLHSIYSKLQVDNRTALAIIYAQDANSHLTSPQC